MKRIIIGILLLLSINISFGQNLPNYDAIKLEVKEDYNTTANDAALQAANFILSTPVDENNMDRLKSMQYIFKWMSGSPDYNFEVGEPATKFSKRNDYFLGIYMAAMTKYVLENKDDAKNQNKIKLNAVKSVIEYAKIPANNVKLNSELKKAIEADAKGELSTYLKIETE